MRGDKLNKGINLDELLCMVQVSDALLCYRNDPHTSFDFGVGEGMRG